MSVGSRHHYARSLSLYHKITVAHSSNDVSSTNQAASAAVTVSFCGNTDRMAVCIIQGFAAILASLGKIMTEQRTLLTSMANIDSQTHIN